MAAAAPAQRRVAARAAEAPAGAPRTAPAYSDCTRVVEKEDGLNISELSFGTIGVTVGLSMLLYGFGAFFNYLPGQSGSAPLLIYGFIISLLGSALKYAQLDPLDCRTYEDADKLRASQATDIQVQVKSDTTRYRYGDEQHLEEALERIFLFGRRAAGGIARRDSPELVGLQERVINGFYALVLVFESPKVRASAISLARPRACAAARAALGPVPDDRGRASPLPAGGHCRLGGPPREDRALLRPGYLVRDLRAAWRPV